VFCALALIAGVLPTGGCSTSYQIGSQKEQKEEDKPLPTGSVAASASQQPVDEEVQLPPDADLAFAKVALSEVLTRGAADASMPWENPNSGARGTITPLANSYRMEGALCRDFLASYVSEGSESWMQGEACRVRLGKWEVRRLKPWRRT
jgi:surface antigen